MLFWNQIFVQNMCGNQNNLSNTSAMYVRRKLQGVFYDGRHCSSQIVYPNVLITRSCRPAAREFEPINKKMITLNILEVVVVKNFIHLYSEFISSTKNSNNLNLLTCIYINTKNGNNLNSFTCIYINSVYDSSFFLIISHFRSYFISTLFKNDIQMGSCFHAIPVLFRFLHIVTLKEFVRVYKATVSLLTTKAYNLEVIYSAHKTAKHDR